MSGESVYDRLAPHYRGIARTRAAYLDAVDRYVAAHAPRGGRLLDVGAADGVRAVGIARTIAASYLVLCEPSARMYDLCRTQPADEVWRLPAESLPRAAAGGFDVITCLWNVLGHLPGRMARVEALRAMRRLLAPKGVLFCDVNNRHNTRTYGRVRVALRRLVDTVVPDEARGDARFEWRVGRERIPAQGHLFTASEMRGLIAAASLRIDDECGVDYVTGATSPGTRAGQLVYRLRVAETDPQEPV